MADAPDHERRVPGVRGRQRNIGRIGQPRRHPGGEHRYQAGGRNDPERQEHGLLEAPHIIGHEDRGQDGNQGRRPRGRGGHGQQAGGRNDPERRGPRPERETRIMGFKRCEELETKPPNEILLTVNNEQSGFVPLMNKQLLTPGFVALILQVAAKACLCTSSPQTLISFLNKLRVSCLLTHTIPNYITSMTVEKSVERQRRYREPLKKLMLLMKELLERMPSSFTNVVPVISTLEFVIRTLRTTSSIVDEELNQQLDGLISLQEEVIKTQAEVRQKKTEEVDENAAPPDDFRTISVFPTMDDIHINERPFLRVNKTKGRYDDVNHYLDVQFRLLREDFVAPLRDGISEYLKSETRGQKKKVHDIRLYHEVHVLNPICTPTGIAYRISFDVARLRYVRWEATKRLIFGSLVCLSKDNFKTLLFATVSDRHPNRLKDGQVTVIFEHNNQEVSAIAPDDTFLMAETSAYFEAYRHVLKGLIDTPDDDSFPFYKYIVECKQMVAAPKYLRNTHQRYDLSCLIEKPEEGALARSARAVPIFDDRKWPDATSLNLDRSQYEALKAALTREFTLIQGPPGTGKTFLGLKVVSALLENKALWCPPQMGNHPILVVCYTNHALDQFLEGIQTFCRRGIVRVGGRSTSEALEQYYLRNLRQKVRERREVNRAIYEGRLGASKDMEILKVDIERTAAKVEASERGLLHEEFLRPYMGEHHYETLTDLFVAASVNDFTSGKRPSAMLEWLGLGDFVYMEEGDGIDVEEAEDIDAEEGIDIEEEAEALARQRILDADDYLVQRMRQDAERELQDKQAAENTLAVNFDDIDDGQVVAQQDRDGVWERQRHQKRREKQQLKRRLRSLDAMTREEANRVDNGWALPVPQRWRLYRYWLNEYRRQLRRGIRLYEEQYQQAAERLKEVRNQEDMAIMKEAAVIGMTTTAAARYRLTLQEIRPKIIVIEEAAEVLEAHIVTTLSAGCEHLILIGDHKQLRPSPNVYKLAERFNLKISLFERMFNNKVPCEILEKQHRMRPQISGILTHIYPELQDHESVMSYENVKGVSKNIFFINHDHKEDMIVDMKSRFNEHEAKFIAAFCRYLLLQGYKPNQITILTLYTGQLIHLRKYMPKAVFGGVRVTAVDNFQGEENDIILLSLVRSNMEDSIGFLREDNRVCVALSRARIGFFAIGNLDLLAKKSNLWSKVVSSLLDMGCCGKALELYCQNHPNEANILVSCAKDFDKAPEGGCLVPCDTRLPCGHVCSRVCHTYDREHKDYQCKKKCCKDLCEQGHKCAKSCYQKCGPCKVQVRKRIPSCGHVQDIPCHLPVTDFSCREACNFPLDCGHKCQNLCGVAHSYKCNETVTQTFACGHMAKVRCHETQGTIACPSKCRSHLDCGHPCTGTCGTCFMQRLHTGCKSKCNRTLVCGHACIDICTKNCPSCSHKCQNSCIHSRCTRKCGEPCVPCNEPCPWQCRHFKCTRLCHQPCNRPRCDIPCNKRLTCGHPCIGLCGEKCPTKCRECDKDEVEEIFFGTEEAEEGEPLPRFVQLEDCGHVLEVEGLDHWMSESASNPREATSIQLKACPKCKTVIRKNLRYGSQIKQMLNDIEKVKELVLGRRDQVNVEKRRLDTEISLLRDVEAAQNLRKRLGYDYLTLEDVETVAKASLFIKHIDELQRKATKSLKDVKDNASLRVNVTAILDALEVVRSWVLQQSKRFSDQEQREGSQEIDRLSFLWQARVLEAKAETFGTQLKPTTKYQLHKLIDLLTDNKPLTPDRREEVRANLEQLKLDIRATGLAIDEVDRAQIIKAVGLSRGHWFKCPNGHFYAIGECGGATQVSKCPDCGKAIGGTNHRLLEDNTLATEMDGAAYAAWSDQANMANYDLEHLM